MKILLTSIIIILFTGLSIFAQTSEFYPLHPSPHCTQIQLFKNYKDSVLIVNRTNDLLIVNDSTKKLVEVDWNLDYPAPIYDLQYVNDSSYFALVDGWRIYSNNNGQSFSYRPNFNEHSRVKFISDSIAYARDNKILYKTLDGGFTYTKIDSFQFIILTHFTAEDHVYIVTYDQLFYSLDGGDNWVTKDLPFGYPYAINTNSLGHIFIGGNKSIWRSKDGGNTYDKYEFEADDYNEGSETSEIVFNNDSIGYAVGALHVAITNDYGNSWTNIPYKESKNMYAVAAYINKENDLVLRDLRGTFDLHYYDFSDQAWSLLSNYDFGHLSSLQYLESDSTYYVASLDLDFNEKAKILKSKDFGYTWDEYITIENSGLFATAYDFQYSIFDNKILYGDWEQGKIFSSTDHGISWQTVYDIPEFLYYGQVHFASEDIWYLTPDGYSLQYTIDKGQNWNNINFDSSDKGVQSIFPHKDNPNDFFFSTYGNSITSLVQVKDFNIVNNWVLDQQLLYPIKPIYYKDDFYMTLFTGSEYIVKKFPSDGQDTSRLCIPILADNEITALIAIFNEDSLLYSAKNAFVLTDMECSYIEVIPMNDCDYSNVNSFISHSFGEGIGINQRQIVSYTKNFQEDLLVSIEETAFSNLKMTRSAFLYPNPTSGALQFNIDLSNPTVFFYSTDGKRIGTYEGHSFTLDQNMKGLYFYTVLEDGKYVNTGKIVVE